MQNFDMDSIIDYAVEKLKQEIRSVKGSKIKDIDIDDIECNDHRLSFQVIGYDATGKPVGDEYFSCSLNFEDAPSESEDDIKWLIDNNAPEFAYNFVKNPVRPTLREDALEKNIPVRSEQVNGALDPMEEQHTYQVFHGSDTEFEEFDVNRSGEAFNGFSMWGDGVYFTDTKDLASSFGKYTYYCEIHFDNPYIIDNSDAEYGEMSADAQKYNELTDGNNDILREQGYDGIISKNVPWQKVDDDEVFRATEYVMFNTDNIMIMDMYDSNGLDEAVEITANEMKARYGTDNPDIINAGKPEEERVALKENSKEFSIHRESELKKLGNGDADKFLRDTPHPLLHDILDYIYDKYDEHIGYSRHSESLYRDGEYYIELATDDYGHGASTDLIKRIDRDVRNVFGDKCVTAVIPQYPSTTDHTGMMLYVNDIVADDWSCKYEGVRAIFHAEDFDWNEDTDLMNELDGEVCTIKWLSIDNDNFKDSYWGIDFEDGTHFDAISGYALDVLDTPKNESKSISEERVALKEDASGIIANTLEEFCNLLGIEYKRQWGAGLFYPTSWNVYREFEDMLRSAGLGNLPFYYYHPKRDKGDPDAIICVEDDGDENIEYVQVTANSEPIYASGYTPTRQIESVDESKSINTYNVTFYMDSLDDNVMSGPSTTKKITASSKEEAEKKLRDECTDKYYIPTITDVELVEEITREKLAPGDRVYVTVSNRQGHVLKLIGDDLVEVELDGFGFSPTRIDTFYVSEVEKIDMSPDFDDDIDYEDVDPDAVIDSLNEELTADEVRFRVSNYLKSHPYSHTDTMDEEDICAEICDNLFGMNYNTMPSDLSHAVFTEVTNYLEENLQEDLGHTVGVALFCTASVEVCTVGGVDEDGEDIYEPTIFDDKTPVNDILKAVDPDTDEGDAKCAEINQLLNAMPDGYIQVQAYCRGRDMGDRQVYDAYELYDELRDIFNLDESLHESNNAYTYRGHYVINDGRTWMIKDGNNQVIRSGIATDAEAEEIIDDLDESVDYEDAFVADDDM